MNSPFIDLPIAVVVLSIANFPSLYFYRFANGPFPFDTNLPARRTDVRCRLTTSGQFFIYQPIAIIIDTIARFGHIERNQLTSTPNTTIAALHTSTFLSGSNRECTVSFQIFIDKTITIIIEVVTDLLSDGHGLSAHLSVLCTAVVKTSISDSLSINAHGIHRKLGTLVAR